MINKYKKKYRTDSKIIEAIQHNSKNLNSIIRFIANLENKFIGVNEQGQLIIKTSNRKIKVNIGDYIINKNGKNLYPCKADIFKTTYEKVPDLNTAIGIMIKHASY